MGDLITRIKDTNAFIDTNEKIYSTKELDKYLKKMKQGYDLIITDKKYGGLDFAYKIDIVKKTIEVKNHYYTCSNNYVYRKFFKLKEAREFAKRFCKVIGAIKINKISERGEENIECFVEDKVEI